VKILLEEYTLYNLYQNGRTPAKHTFVPTTQYAACVGGSIANGEMFTLWYAI